MKALKAVMIHADGEIELLNPSEALGRNIHRTEKCNCGRVLRSRIYEAHFASNGNTVVDGAMRGAPDDANAGTIVFIERPA